jgi:hypothetical protein
MMITTSNGLTMASAVPSTMASMLTTGMIMTSMAAMMMTAAAMMTTTTTKKLIQGLHLV